MTVDKIERANMASILDKFSFLPRFENENLKNFQLKNRSFSPAAGIRQVSF